MSSELVVPLALSQELVGAVSFTSAERRAWGEALQAELSLVGELIACAYHRVWYELQLRAAQEQAEAALAEVERLKEQLEAENLHLREEIERVHGFAEIVGESPAFLACLQAVDKVAPTDSTVLILGESGTGKELIARSVHGRSARKDGPFVALNCAALPANLVESELFGHEKGAFTGADARRQGRFELAQGGTLFLDEIGDLPLELQAKLLRVLQEGELQRVGGRETIAVDVRVLAATHRELEKEVEAERFRADLFYRLNVFPIALPSLRERIEDVQLLAQHFARKHAQRLGRDGLEGISAKALRQLKGYAWPGNVRELENVIVRGLIAGQGPLLELAGPLGAEPGAGGSLRLEDVERRHIAAVLEQTGWTVEGEAGAAGLLGLAPSTLRSRMKRLGIERPGS
jgi:transcriptional regulator with GAF, ATPase, and Fis domain